MVTVHLILAVSLGLFFSQLSAILELTCLDNMLLKPVFWPRTTSPRIQTRLDWFRVLVSPLLLSQCFCPPWPRIQAAWEEKDVFLLPRSLGTRLLSVHLCMIEFKYIRCLIAHFERIRKQPLFCQNTLIVVALTQAMPMRTMTVIGRCVSVSLYVFQSQVSVIMWLSLWYTDILRLKCIVSGHV